TSTAIAGRAARSRAHASRWNWRSRRSLVQVATWKTRASCLGKTVCSHQPGTAEVACLRNEDLGPQSHKLACGIPLECRLIGGMPTHDGAAAQRLALALLQDLSRYNRAKLSAGADPRTVLGAEINEARALFHARVAPPLHSVFERELGVFDFAAGQKPGAVGAPGPALISALLLGLVLMLS